MTSSAATRRIGQGGGILKYPKELSEGAADYMTFRHSEYRTNRAMPGQQEGRGPVAAGGRGAPPAEPTSSAIVFYMPSNTPPSINGNGWGKASYDGPLGVALSGAQQALVGGISDTNLEDFKTPEKAKAWGESGGNAILKQVESTLSSKNGEQSLGTGAAQQAGITMVGGGSIKGANQLLAMNRGQIYNPNVELLYDGPSLRSFVFHFDMFPKSADEAATVNRIVKEFKIWSAPEAAANGMYNVPHVWEIEYSSGSGQNLNLNEFKKCACVNVAVTNNQNVKGYMSFENGMPIQTSLTLSFTEVDVITRNDQQEARSTVGF